MKNQTEGITLNHAIADTIELKRSCQDLPTITLNILEKERSVI
jgi:hypothetical protein